MQILKEGFAGILGWRGVVAVASLALRACAGVVVVISFKEGFAFDFFASFKNWLVAFESLALRACAGVVVVISFKEGFAFDFFASFKNWLVAVASLALRACAGMVVSY